MGKPFGRHQPSILLVDGHDDTRALYKLVLGPMARTIEEACDGVEAYGRALSRRHDLIVTETRLARMDGLTLVRRLRSEPRHRDCALLVVTASASEELAEQLLDAGADQILLKPCDSVALLSAAQRLTWRATCVEPEGVLAGASHFFLLQEHRHDAPQRRRSRRPVRT